MGDVEVKSSGTTLHFGKGQVKRGLKRGRNNLQNQFFSNLKGSVENAQYSHFEEADELHPNVAGQDVYYTALKIGTKIYAIEIKADVLKNHQGNIYSYAGHKVVCLEKSQDSDPGLKPADYPDSISISDFEEIFKHMYGIYTYWTFEQIDPKPLRYNLLGSSNEGFDGVFGYYTRLNTPSVYDLLPLYRKNFPDLYL